MGREKAKKKATTSLASLASGNQKALARKELKIKQQMLAMQEYEQRQKDEIFYIKPTGYLTGAHLERMMKMKREIKASGRRNKEKSEVLCPRPLDASEDTLLSLQSKDPNFKIQEKAVEYVRALNVVPLEVVFARPIDEVRGKFVEFSKDKESVERPQRREAWSCRHATPYAIYNLACSQRNVFVLEKSKVNVYLVISVLKGAPLRRQGVVRREAWPSRYETDPGFGSRRDERGA
nr:hypothetical protein [Tanacetum cinerariifolium]